MEMEMEMEMERTFSLCPGTSLASRRSEQKPFVPDYFCLSAKPAGAACGLHVAQLVKPLLTSISGRMLKGLPSIVVYSVWV